MKTFSEVGITQELVSALNKINFLNSTEVQERAIPIIMSGKDIIVRAKTGTGKTGAFLIPIIDRIKRNDKIAAIIMVPTRELALQVSEVAQKLSIKGIKVATVYGGASMNNQAYLIRNGANIIIGTPGRILDLIERRILDLTNIKYLVLDEADVMLDMGFIDDISDIISKTPRTRQTMLFSATMPREITDIARRYMKPDKETLIVGEEEDIIVNNIMHSFAVVPDNKSKYMALLAYIEEYKPSKAIVFANMKSTANSIYNVLRNQGLNAILLHGGLTQAKRERSLSIFKEGAQILIATNIASRGLDVLNISDIINFDVPDTTNIYIHRVGRSARMGKNGKAFTLVTNSQKAMIREIAYSARIEMNMINLNIEKFKNIKLDFYSEYNSRGFNHSNNQRNFRGYNRGKRHFEKHVQHNSRGGHWSYENN
ncbi:MAG: DEAD/DEAH box helicase [Candidatus Micrarchaeia archaeon]